MPSPLHLELKMHDSLKTLGQNCCLCELPSLLKKILLGLRILTFDACILRIFIKEKHWFKSELVCLKKNA